MHNNNILNTKGLSHPWIYWETKQPLHWETTADKLRWGIFFETVSGALKKGEIESIDEIRTVHILVGPEP